MIGITSLDLEFQLSHQVFDKSLSSIGLSLSSCFPNLTSLSIRSLSDKLPAAGWSELLPQSLLSLTLHFELSVNVIDAQDPYYLSKSLPKGLQLLELGPHVCIGGGTFNLRPFENLRVARLLHCASWDVLDFLPNSLEELRVKRPYCTPLETPARFPISKIPPKIRVLEISGEDLIFDFDCTAPYTLEDLTLVSNNLLEPQNLENFFNAKNLRIASIRPVRGPFGPVFALMPNLEDYGKPMIATDSIDSLEILPRKLTSVSLYCHTASHYLPLKHLPPTLKDLSVHDLRAEDISELPKKLLSLKIFGPSASFSSEVLAQLPDRLTTLEVPLQMFESEHCFNVLPGTLEKLILNISGCEWFDKVSFPEKLRRSLKTISISHNKAGPTFAAEKISSFVSKKLIGFSCLSALKISAIFTVDIDALSNLPKSLISLDVECEKLENGGVLNSDFENGVFSRLPEGLQSFRLSFTSNLTTTIDYMIFSRLPKGLAALQLRTLPVSGFLDPNAFLAILPRRIARFQYSFGYPSPSLQPDLYLDGFNASRQCLNSLDKAVVEQYYSDPFWDGTVLSRRVLMFSFK